MLRFLPVVSMQLATALTLAACGATGVSSRGRFPYAGPPASAFAAAAVGTGAAVPTAAPTATATGDAPRQAAPPASPPAGQAGFAGALAAWKTAAAASAATMDVYLLQAAGDLRASGRPGSGTAVSQLTYLAHLPATDVPPAQMAKARFCDQALDSFFGTPGLMS